jgi:hypothetical protein
MTTIAKWSAIQKAITLQQDGKTSMGRGLVKTLQCLFYPNYKPVRGVSLRKPSVAKREGRALDRFVNSLVTRPHLPGKTDAERVLKDVLGQHGWTPVCAQLPVGDARMRLGTKIDLLCRGVDGKSLFLIEIKLGYAPLGPLSYWKIPQGSMQHPYQDVENSAFHHHVLQAAWSLYLLKQTQTPWATAISMAYVLRIGGPPTAPYDLVEVPDSLIRAEAITALMNSKNENRAKRSRSIARSQKANKRQKH